MQSLKAQTEDETIEWLNIKKSEITTGGCGSNAVRSFGGKIEVIINSEKIELLGSNGSRSSNPWDAIKEVKNDFNLVKIIFKNVHQNEPEYIYMMITNDEIRNKYLKAVKHLATIKGAILIKEDLF